MTHVTHTGSGWSDGGGNGGRMASCEGKQRIRADVDGDGMNLRGEVRARVQRRRRRVHGNPEPRPGCPHPISIRFERFFELFYYAVQEESSGFVPDANHQRVLRRLRCAVNISKGFPMWRTRVITIHSPPHLRLIEAAGKPDGMD